MPEAPCRNCGSKERYCGEISPPAYMLPVGWVGWGGPKFEIQVCGSCGLVDWFVAQNLLPKVKQKFVRMDLP
jgi:hypothetical protein